MCLSLCFSSWVSAVVFAAKLWIAWEQLCVGACIFLGLFVAVTFGHTISSSVRLCCATKDPIGCPSFQIHKWFAFINFCRIYNTSCCCFWSNDSFLHWELHCKQSPDFFQICSFAARVWHPSESQKNISNKPPSNCIMQHDDNISLTHCQKDWQQTFGPFNKLASQSAGWLASEAACFSVKQSARWQVSSVGQLLETTVASASFTVISMSGST